MSTKFSFNIGCDPEFLVFKGDKHINMERLMQLQYKSASVAVVASEGVAARPAYTLVNMGYNVGASGNCGWDHGGAVSEIRPMHSKDVDEVVKNIGELVSFAQNTAPGLTITTLSLTSPVGGHIHLEIPKKFRSDTRFELIAQRCLASFLVPILMSQHNVSSNARSKSNGYGKLSDFRFENKGDSRTIEVRCPNAEWIISPEIAKATLAYLGVVWNEIITNGDKVVKMDFVLKHADQVESLDAMLLSNYSLVSDTILGRIKKAIKKFERYQDFAAEIDLILDPKAMQTKKMSLAYSPTKGWGGPAEKIKAPTRKELLSKTAIKKAAIEKDGESVMSGVLFNNDAFVSVFADAISSRVLFLNWQLQNEYFFFGIKKGRGDSFLTIKTKGSGISIKNHDILSADSTWSLKDVDAVFSKMYQKLLVVRDGVTPTISPQTGALSSGAKKIVLIGLPHAMRAEGDVKSLIAHVIDIEKGVQPIVQSSLATTEPTAVDQATENIEASIGVRAQTTTNIGNALASHINRLNESQTLCAE